MSATIHPLKMNQGFRAVGMLAMLAAAMMVFLPSALAAPQGANYRVPLASEPSTLDPAKLSDVYAINVSNNLFDGLVEFDAKLNVRPAIAKIWKISRDHQSYLFRLRRGVKFHSGREVTAEDFVYSFKRILSPELKSPAASLFLKIKGAEAFHEGQSQTIVGLAAPDPYTLTIELEKPFAPFLSILAMANAKVVPKEAIGEDFDRKPIGTGPFRFHSWEPETAITLTANRKYFADQPKLNTLRFIIYKNVDWESVYGDFEKGLLDQSLIPSGEYEQASLAAYPRAEKPTLISKPGLNIVYLGLNTTMAPFQDRRVRQAIYHAVDREKIVKENTRWRSMPAKGVLPPGIAGFNPLFEGYAYDPQKARQLLAESGYPGGRGIPPIELWTVAKTERVHRQLEAYRDFLGEIGIQVIPKVAENWKEFIARINDKQAAMYYAAWYADFPDPDNFLFNLCHSESRSNRMGYQSEEVDRMLEAARSETDYGMRVELYREIEKKVMYDAPLIAQHVNSFNYVFQPWVKGVEMSHLGATYLPFRRIWIDRDKRLASLQPS